MAFRPIPRFVGVLVNLFLAGTFLLAFTYSHTLGLGESSLIRFSSRISGKHGRVEANVAVVSTGLWLTMHSVRRVIKTSESTNKKPTIGGEQCSQQKAARTLLAKHSYHKRYIKHII